MKLKKIVNSELDNTKASAKEKLKTFKRYFNKYNIEHTTKS